MQNNEASPSTVLFPVFVRVQQLHDVPSLKTMSHVRAGLQKVPVPRKGATRAGIPVTHTSEGHNQHEPVDQRVLDQLAPISEKRVGGMSAPHSGAHWAQGHVLVRTCNIQPHKTLHDWAHSEQTQQHVGKLQSGCKLAKQLEQPLSLLEVYPPMVV